MVELILKLYTMYMATDVRTPLPHLFGPPGCGKSTSVEKAAEILGVNLHVINVSRLSPLEIEGVQMPDGVGEEQKLHMLLATMWSRLKPGDIVLWDELLRGFPEVYNGLLDIFTGRVVAGHVLPKVFMLGASNSTVAYDKALEDRLLHLPVDDPRTKATAKKHLAQLIVDELGLMPNMATSMEMETMLQTEVLPMFKVLDSLGKANTSPVTVEGKSVRNLIGQAQLRQIETPTLKKLIDANNSQATVQSKEQYVFLYSGKQADLPSAGYPAVAEQMRGSDKLGPKQALNLELNLQLIKAEAIRQERGTNVDDDALDEIFS